MKEVIFGHSSYRAGRIGQVERAEGIPGGKRLSDDATWDSAKEALALCLRRSSVKARRDGRAAMPTALASQAEQAALY